MAELISHEPATGAELWRGETSDVDAEVDRVARAWPGWAARPLAYRIETMRRFTNAARAGAEALADRIARETGRPLWDARTEVAGLIDQVDTAIAAYSERTGRRRLTGALDARQAVRHKPHGVMAVIGPSGTPAQPPNGHIVAALVAGNGVAFKPSEKTPATGAMLVELYHRAGVPEDLLRLIVGGPAEGQALAKHPAVGAVAFTGSAATGVALSRQFAARPDRLLALAMGGNNPIVVWDTGDLASAAVLVAQSAFLSSGQRCTAARRLIVRETLHAPLMAELKKIADRLIVDHPHADPVPFMGPVADNRAADGLTESFLILMSNGGRPIRHMTRPWPDLPFVSPAIIDVTDMPERPDVELFGPLLQVVRVPSFEAAIAEANNSRFGLAATLVGGSPQQYDQFWANVRAGVVNWNRSTHAAGASAPLAGLGLSGNHRPGGWYAADHCAYPVASSEADQPRASIGVGLRDIDVTAMGA